MWKQHNRQNAAKWCYKFKVGRSDVYSWKKWKAICCWTSDETIQNTEENCVDRHLTIDELHEQCVEVSKTVLYGMVMELLGQTVHTLGVKNANRQL